MADSTPAPKPSNLPILVSKPTPYTFDLGLLCAFDPNPLQLSSSENLEADLAATARDGAQALLNQLLSTCPIVSTPAGVLLPLPCSLSEGDVAVQWKFREPFDAATRLRPLHFNPVDLRTLPNAQNHPWIVRRKEAASAHLHPRAR